jgi:hypothetical protein
MRAPDVGDLPVKKGEGFNMVGFLGYPLLIEPATCDEKSTNSGARSGHQARRPIKFVAREPV